MSDPFQVSKAATGALVPIAGRQIAHQQAMGILANAHLLASDIRRGGPLALVAKPKPPKLGPGEAFHGTNSRSARAIEAEGFKLADPKAKPQRNGRVSIYAPRTTRTGRPIAARQEQGTGVYATTNWGDARNYAGQQAAARGGTPRVLRVSHPTDLKRMDTAGRVRDEHAVSQAVRSGHSGVEVRGDSILGAQRDIAVGDPRKVKPLGEAKPDGWEFSPGRAGGTALTATAGGLSLHDAKTRAKIRKGSPVGDPFQIRKDAARRQADDFLRSLPEGRHKVPVERVDPAVRGSGLRLYDRRYVARMALAMDADPKLRAAPTRFAVHPDGQVRQVDGAHRYAARHMRGEARVPIQIERSDQPSESKGLKVVYRPAKARLQRARRARDRGMDRQEMQRLATRVPRWADPVNQTLSTLQKSMRLPSGERVRFRVSRMNPYVDQVEAFKRGKNIGYMHLHKPDGPVPGKIAGVEVLPEFRRKKVATGMFRHAKGRGLRPAHTPYPEQFSPEGKAWAEKVGKSYLGEGAWESASRIPSQTRKVMLRGYRNAAKARAAGTPNLPAEPTKRLPARAYVAGKGMGNVVSANAEHVQFRPDSHDAVYHLNRKAVSFRRAKKRR